MARKIGKQMGHDLYVHKDYVGSTNIPHDVLSTAKQHLQQNHPNFDYTIIKHNKETNNVSFLHSPDWDTEHEPHIHHSVLVKPSGETKYMAPKKDQQIYHQKWQFVGDDYKGFDINRSKLRTTQYMTAVDHLKKTTGDNSISKKIGQKSYWEKEVVPHIKESTNMKTFKNIMEEIANVTGTATTDTGGISEPATAKSSEKKKVVLFKTIEKRKELNPDGK